MRLFLSFLLLTAVLPTATLETVPQPSVFFFEENSGQVEDPEAVLLVRGGPDRAYLTANALRLFSRNQARGGSAVRVRFAAAGSSPALQPIVDWPGRVHRFERADDGWRRDQSAYSRVQFPEVFPGVDLTLSGEGARIVLTYAVKPGADPRAILLESDVGTVNLHQGRLHVSGAGNLGGASWTFETPSGRQDTTAGPISIDVSFRQEVERQAGFQTGEYDSAQTLYIEFAIDGGGGLELTPTAVDEVGNVYYAGSVASSVVCQTREFDAIELCRDAYVAAADPEGRPLFYTVLAGAGNDAAAFVAPDGAGGLAVVGNTGSVDFPVTSDAFQEFNGGAITQNPQDEAPGYGDLFLAHLDAETGLLLYSTFYGGPEGESFLDADMGPDSSVTVLTRARPTFPTTPGSWLPDYQPSCRTCIGGSGLVTFDFNAGRPRYASFYPGSPLAIAVHHDGSAYIAGYVIGPAPVTPGAYQTEFVGQTHDAYIVRVAPDGSAPIFATYYSPGGLDIATEVVAAGDGSAWVLAFANGQFAAPLSPITPIPPMPLLARLSPDGSNLEAQSLQHSPPTALVSDGAGGVVLLSEESSPSLPITPGAWLPGECSGSYLRKFASTGETTFASYLPPAGYEPVRTFGGLGNALHLQTSQGRLDRLAIDNPTPPAIGCAVHAAGRWNRTLISPGGIFSLIGIKMGPEVGVAGAPVDGRFPKELGGVRVLVDGMPAPLLFVQAGQINFVAPYDLIPGRTVEVVVEFDGAAVGPLSVHITAHDFALFSLSGSGRGQAAALNQDGSLNGRDNPAEPGSIVVLYGAGAGVTAPASVDGELAPFEDLPRIAAAVAVSFGEQLAEVLYAGSAPGLVNGVVQINVRLPEDLSSGVQPVDVTVNGLPSLSRPTIRVR